MIKIENLQVYGWEAAVRGMRNAKNSWSKSDSKPCEEAGCPQCGYMEKCEYNSCYDVGDNDMKLMKSLCEAGSDHRKFLRMITVYVDITAPLYWWKEYDTYKVGTVANSCSTMHKIAAKEFTFDDFSCEHLYPATKAALEHTIDELNHYRAVYLDTKSKDDWWQMIQLLPSSYNQRRTVMLNYEVLRNQYHARKNHKLDEWHDCCHWIESLPYAKELIIGEEEDK